MCRQLPATEQLLRIVRSGRGGVAAWRYNNNFGAKIRSQAAAEPHRRGEGERSQSVYKEGTW